jgi:hypothetical protein
MASDLALERHALAIRKAWSMVRDQHPGILRPGRDVYSPAHGRFPYDYLLDQAWFESMDGATQPIAGITLWSFAESETASSDLRRWPERPPDPSNRLIHRPVGLFTGGDLLVLATIGRSNVIGKIQRVAPSAINLIRTDHPSRPCDVALSIAKAANWIITAFRS